MIDPESLVATYTGSETNEAKVLSCSECGVRATRHCSLCGPDQLLFFCEGHWWQHLDAEHPADPTPHSALPNTQPVVADFEEVTQPCTKCGEPSAGFCFLHRQPFCKEHYAEHVVDQHPAWPQVQAPTEPVRLIAGDAVDLIPPSGGLQGTITVEGKSATVNVVSHPVGSTVDHDSLPPEYLAAYWHGVAEERRATIDWLRKRCDTNPPCDPMSDNVCQFCQVAHHIESR